MTENKNEDLGAYFRIPFKEKEVEHFFVKNPPKEEEIKYFSLFRKKVLESGEDFCVKFVKYFPEYFETKENEEKKEKVFTQNSDLFFFNFCFGNGFHKKQEEMFEIFKIHAEWNEKVQIKNFQANTLKLIADMTKEKAMKEDFLYNFGHDPTGHPVLYCNLGNYSSFIASDGKLLVDMFNDVCTFVISDALRNAPKNIFSIVLVVNVENAGISIISLIAKAAKPVTLHTGQFIEVLHKAIVIRHGWIIGAIVKAAFLFCDKRVVEKYIFAKSDDEVKNHIETSQIPKQFGGSANLNYTFQSHTDYLTKNEFNITKIPENEKNENEKKE